MAKRKRLRRKHYFIKKDYQTKFILKFSALILAGALISTVLLLFLSQDTLTSTFVDSRLVVKNTSAAIFPAIILTNVIMVAVVSLAAIVVVLVVSHKIAGPMYRFEREIVNIGEGDLSKTIALREKDQFENMAQCLDGMVASLRSKVTSIYDAVEGAIAKVNRQEATKEMASAELEKLKAIIDGQFKR